MFAQTSVKKAVSSIGKLTHICLSQLNPYHIIPWFKHLAEETFGKHCGKRRKCWYPVSSPFPSMFYA